MKKTLLLITSVLFITSAAFSQSKMDINNLIDRGGLLYAPNNDKPFSGSVFEFYENGTEKLNGKYRKGIKNGKWEWWSATGIKDSLGTYKNGIKHGKWTFWYDSGVLLGEQKWKNGMADGLFAKWYENGEKESEETFKDGEKDGLWTYWHDNRKKKRELTFKDGKEDGLFTEWYWIGRKKEEGTYKDGNQDGGWTYYTDFVNGKYEVRYTTGNIDSATFTDNLGQTYSGILIQDYDEATRVDGQYLYQSWAYDFSIYPEIFATIKNGKKDGLWETFYLKSDNNPLVLHGPKKSRGNYKDGENNGQLYYRENWKNGKRDGIWEYFDEDGNLTESTEWKDGELIE